MAMHKIFTFNPSNILNVNWEKSALIIITGCAISLLTVVNCQYLSIFVVFVSFIIAAVQPMRCLTQLLHNKQIITNLWNIVNSEQLVDYFHNKDGKSYPYNSVIIDVFSNNKLYRLDFYANGIVHSDAIYKLDNRITEAFNTVLIDKHRNSWGMSYFIATKQ